MASSTNEPKVVRVSQKGQATIPKDLREKFGIETPGEVFVYEDQGRIIIKPVPSPDELHGIHSGEREYGEVLERIREIKDAEKRKQDKRAERLRPSKDV
ncbi:AbrB/MazE/SpoVT family DNA-binding domain-containing protein [Haloquadratum walsbyi]|jgi:looped-hinge helix DNA binding domain, AbrB family|uniref:Looped-hinge helix DNA binding domain, AbrB family n=1 Tax=Haloquadratum walsbyi J07HQW2 TaxID=1238425 RepID=U1NFA9_9EURY|nr:AbrB/MazE/SpoVT family DNA-binding domain-containing protein [Haloquadratum walsbyi]ERG95760.1 MAG: looped-hinge helix DNA binding domain, AbrB family [Haloquadratum walsbyi J07HQW2]